MPPSIEDVVAVAGKAINDYMLIETRGEKLLEPKDTLHYTVQPPNGLISS